MKNRTVYEVLDKVMENYTYTIEQTGKKVHLFGKVYIERVDVTVTHEKTFYKTDGVNSGYKFENDIKSFKEELKSKVAEVIKSHAEELTDDEAMIDKLLYEVKSLRKTVKELEEELNEAKSKINGLEFEKLTREPIINPATPYPNPWTTGTTPWITYEHTIGDQPDWMDKNNITCSSGDSVMNTSVSYNDYNDWKNYTSALDSDLRDRLKGTSERYG